jgi:hypothetical protein
LVRKSATAQTNPAIRWWAIEHKSTIAAHWQGKNQNSLAKELQVVKHQQ